MNILINYLCFWLLPTVVAALRVLKNPLFQCLPLSFTSHDQVIIYTSDIHRLHEGQFHSGKSLPIMTRIFTQLEHELWV